MTAGYEESNGRWNSQPHHWLLKISTELRARAAAIFQGARNSCVRCAGALTVVIALGAMPSVLTATEGDYTAINKARSWVWV